MKIKERGYNGTSSLAEWLRRELLLGNYDGSLEEASHNAENAISALALLVEKLVDRNILTLDDASSLVGVDIKIERID